MGWLIAAAAVFVILAFIVTLSLCMAAGDEDDDAEQMKWITYINAQFPPMDLCIRSIPHICGDIR